MSHLENFDHTLKNQKILIIIKMLNKKKESAE
jgi:hypothetical protein